MLYEVITHLLHDQRRRRPILVVVGDTPLGRGDLGGAGRLHHGLGLDEDAWDAAPCAAPVDTTAPAAAVTPSPSVDSPSVRADS